MPTSPLRKIKSFALRQGRLTDRQQEALETEWSRYVLSIKTQEEWSAIFKDQCPLILEIGFGMGQSFFKDAQTHPENHYIGVEVFKPGIGSLLSTLKEYPLSNVNILYGDAVEILTSCVPDATLAQIHIFFPDPWPKRRHHKRRLIQPDFVKLLAQKLKPGGRLHLATDWEDYAKHMQVVLNAEPLFIKQSCAVERTLTKYERRGQRAGHGIWDLVFYKT